jgi:PAS domain S-box-containing protein
MNSKEDQKKPESKIKLLYKRLDPRKYSIKNKLQLLVFAVVFGTILLISVFGLVYHKSVIYKNSVDKLASIQEINKKHIESYFSQIGNQIKILSDNEVVINAIKEFKDAYSAVENDNYYTSSAASIEDVSALLKNYYETEYLEVINDKLDVDMDAGNFIPDNNNSKILQFLYIANNNKPAKLKYQLNRAEDGTVYSDVHNKYHSFFRDWFTKFKFGDIYLVDNKSGDIIYSVSKKLDFATNLLSGPYSRSNLSEAYKSATGAINSGYTITTDFENYYPSFLSPSLFIASPVFDNLEKIGVLVFQVSINTIDDLLHLKKLKDDVETALGVQSVIIGNDRYLRNNDLRLITDKDEYLRTLKRVRANMGVVSKIEKFSTTALIQPIGKGLFSNNNDGYSGQGKYKDISKTVFLCTYTHLNIKDLDWILVTQADTKVLFKSVRTIIYLLIVIGIIIIIFSLLAGASFSKRLSGRINDINKSLVTLSKGETFSDLGNSQYDELRNTVESLNQLMHRINEASDFATNLGEGKFDYEFSSYSENDKLGVSLEKMKNSLLDARDDEEKRKKEDEIRNWTADGIARFNDILRTDNDNIEKLSYNLIKNLIDYLSANQGGFFLLEGEENQEKQLNLIASYAYDRQKYLKKQIKIGEGLAGTCVLEKKTIFLKDIPEDYAEITSGIGGSHPRSVMIVPLKLDDEVLGIIELASFNIFKQHEIEFVEQVALSIASTMVTVKLNTRTAQLLKESNKRAEELAQQEEEMRQNLEEMQATQDELKRLKEDEKKSAEKHRKEQEELMNKLKLQNEELNRVQVDLLKETALLNNLMNFSPDYIYFKDKQSKFIRISKTMAKSFGFKKPEDAVGKSDFDVFTDEHARPAYNDEMEIIKTGKPIVDKIEKETRSDGRVTWVTTTKMPLKDEKGETIGTFGVSSDITKIKNLEIKASEVEEKSRRLQDNLLKETALLNNLMNFSPDYIYFKDRKSKFIRISKTMARSFGFKKPEDAAGKSDFDLFTDEHARPAYNDEMKVIKTGRPIVNKIEKETRSDGRITWVTTTKMPLKDEKGKTIGTFGVSSDITKIKNLEIKASEVEAKSKKLKEELKKATETLNKLKKGKGKK